MKYKKFFDPDFGRILKAFSYPYYFKNDLSFFTKILKYE